MRLFTLLAFLVLSSTAFSQQPIPSNVPPDGVYCSFSAFRNGKPDLVKNQLYRSSLTTEFTLRQWAASENLYFIDGAGKKLSLGRDSLWGYSENGTVYIYLGLKFHKITNLGAISYFLEAYPIIRGNLAPVVTETRGTSAYRLMDLEDGSIYDYTLENFNELLAKDETLYAEFKAINSIKTKKKKMFQYLERFNKLHPLVF